MEITNASANLTRFPGIPSKPLDNPQRSKPTAPEDVEIARRLDPILRALPRLSRSGRATTFPLLDALVDHDARENADLARRLLFVAAQVHMNADERRTAEYLLRNRHDVITSRRSALRLVLAARCAAEMDVRRIQQFEVPTVMSTMLNVTSPNARSRDDDPSVGDAVVEFLSDALGRFPARPVTRARLLVAVAVAVELSQRHALKGGARPSIIAMRSSARKHARLAVHLHAEFGSPVAARGLARLLVGAPQSSLECSLLWWVAQRPSAPHLVPLPIRTRWLNDLSIADGVVLRRAAARNALQRFTAPQAGVSGETPDSRHLRFGT